ncbi:MAG TPA: hypothetical protein VN577_21015 [Terriglobales bacterium]|nr:hypothetical protein [Terriglobales bacterium]
MYYYFTDTDFCISGSILTLIDQGAPLDLDFCALGVFLRLRYYLGDDTPFASIKLIPPAVNFLFEDGRLSVSGGVSIPKPLHMTRSDAIDAFIYTFRNAVRRTRPENEQFVVPLSGGRDSRHIFLELLSSGYRPKCCVSARNFAPWSSEDVEVAAELCDSTGVPLDVLDQPTSILAAEVQKNIDTSLTTIDHAWIVALVDYLKQRHRTVIYEGIAGDIYTGAAASNAERLADWRAGRLHKLADGWLDSKEKLWRKILGKQNYRYATRDIAITRMVTELAKFSQAPNPFASFFFYNRTRRVAALSPFIMLSDTAAVLTPFLDHRVHDLMSALDGEMFLDKKFHTEAIQRAFPKFAKVRYAPNRRSPANNYRFFARAAYDVGKLSLMCTRSGRVLQQSFLWSRLLRSFADRSYSPAMGWLEDLAIYLIQLECAMDRRALNPNA